MKGFCEWPAVVKGFENRLILIEFFGDKKTHKASIKNFFQFKKSQHNIVENIRRKGVTSLYGRAVKEAEIALGIPDELSIFHQV